MALGGGTFTAMDKVLPGAYINIVSKSHAVDNNDRGVAAMAMELDWGPDSKCFAVTASDLRLNALKIFGYELDDDNMQDIREIFQHAKKLICYKLTSGGVKASNTYATALYCGTRGNSITITISANVDDSSKFDVVTKIDGKQVDKQTVAAAADLKDNDFVTFASSATLTAVAGSPLTGGTNGAVTGTQHSAALTAFEGQSFNTLGLDSTDATTKALYVAFTQRMRDTLGVKFQTVLYASPSDYEGIINVKNTVSDTGASAAALVNWVTGAEAGCEVPGSLTNDAYDGEYTVTASYSQTQLEAAIAAGEFTFHMVADEVHVLMDINSLVTYTASKSKLFAKNETMRTIDTVANSVVSLFTTKYIGNIVNNQDGRMSLWSDLAEIHKKLEQVGAITGFDNADLTVVAGENKGDVVVNDAITVTGTMEKLYMSVIID